MKNSFFQHPISNTRFSSGIGVFSFPNAAATPQADYECGTWWVEQPGRGAVETRCERFTQKLDETSNLREDEDGRSIQKQLCLFVQTLTLWTDCLNASWFCDLWAISFEWTHLSADCTDCLYLKLGDVASLVPFAPSSFVFQRMSCRCSGTHVYREWYLWICIHKCPLQATSHRQWTCKDLRYLQRFQCEWLSEMPIAE